jgi:hypothetical protein
MSADRSKSTHPIIRKIVAAFGDALSLRIAFVLADLDAEQRPNPDRGWQAGLAEKAAPARR